MARHLHQEAGGNPAQGPVRELANEPPSPRAADDFPDAPEAPPSQPEGDLDQERLDDFAARLGLDADDDDDADAGDADTAAPAPTSSDESDDTAGDRRVRLLAIVRRAPVTIARRAARPAGRTLVVLSRSTTRTASWLRSTGERLERRSAETPERR